ncbi:hypothetical protein B0H14DRAFT_2643289 [Mycena olivaceomarginata]|nr:hypothetical protein B0H14DRAFT_2643289 [Mycena olivaceomarginata]
MSVKIHTSSTVPKQRAYRMSLGRTKPTTKTRDALNNSEPAVRFVTSNLQFYELRENRRDCGWTDGRTDNRPVPSLGYWSPQHAVPSPDGSEDSRPVHRKTEGRTDDSGRNFCS